MAVISILLILSFTLFYILTRTSTVRLMRVERTRIEIHMQIFAFVINLGRRGERKKKKPSDLSRDAKRKILTAVLRSLKNGELRLNRLAIPYNEASGSSVTRKIRYRILSATLLAYLDTISGRLYYSDDAVILSPDVNSIQYDVSINLRLYELIHAIIKLGTHILKEKIQSVRE